MQVGLPLAIKGFFGCKTENNIFHPGCATEEVATILGLR